jgi:hypothetical protein
MQIAQYEFKPDCRLQPGAKLDSANEVGQHLERLREQYKGELTPADVVKDARNHNSPLHSFFEWNDGEAAEQWRLQQARGLIRAVVAVVVDNQEPAKRIQAFVHVPDPEAPHYRATDHAMSQEKTRDMVLQQAWKEYRSWKKRYEHLEELAELFAAESKVLKRIPQLRD